MSPSVRIQEKLCAIVSGLGSVDDGGIPEFREALQQARPDLRIVTIPGCPAERGSEDPWSLSESVRKALAQTGDFFDVVFGNSYGGTLALGAVLGYGFEKVGRLVPIDAPLDPDVPVDPPWHGYFGVFAKQYAQRKQFARWYSAALQDLNVAVTPKILTIGSEQDQLVPPAAKSLPGVRHISLPGDIGGHKLKPRKIAAILDICNREVFPA